MSEGAASVRSMPGREREGQEAGRILDGRFQGEVNEDAEEGIAMGHRLPAGSMYEIADERAQEAFRGYLRVDPEAIRRMEAAREAADRGDPPTNPISVGDLAALIDDARRARASRHR